MFAQADAKVIILIMLMAIILAVTAALAYFYLLNRPEFPEGTFTVIVEDQPILVQSDPEQLVRLVDPPPSQPQTIIEEITPTETIEAETTEPDGSETQAEEGTGDGVSTTGGEIAPTFTPIVISPIPVSPIPVTPIPATVIPRANQVIIENYQVVQGDTLYNITTKRNTTIALMARYGISATDIVPGTFISLPVANPAFCPGSFPYVVQAGDTLSTIALKCGTTVSNLKQLNGFGDVFRLDETSVICVPNQPTS